MADPATIRYSDAGVSINEADRAVGKIRQYARRTFTKGVLTDIGSFGGGFRLGKYRDPVLVSSADGVGTKLKVAILANRHDTIGEDLVNHCVNDIMVQGANPLFFLDYFATGKLDAKVTAEVVKGIARGCKANECALLGGETAEMPGMYAPEDYDVAGFIVGVVERQKMLTGAKVREGDALIGLPSNGLHTNGYSLARKLLFDVAGYTVTSVVPELGSTVADELLRIHLSYRKPLQILIKARLLNAAAHITGGGITDNLPRVIPKGLAAEIDTTAWRIPRIFTLLRELGRIPEDDWRQTLNLGIGMICVVPADKAEKALRLTPKCRIIGRVSRQSGPRVVYR